MSVDKGRRAFTTGLAASVSAATIVPASTSALARRAYSGPNVIVVRFGGGVRRTETIAERGTYAPYLRHVLARRGVLIPNMTIAQLDGVDTSHAEGTLNILAGRYLAYRDVSTKFLQQHLEPSQPTLFEYLRKTFAVPAHQALLINGEDRPQEEFFSYGVNKHYGVAYRSEVLSLHRFKVWHLAGKIAAGVGTDKDLATARKALVKLRAKDYRGQGVRQAPQIEAFWRRWRRHYGDTGFINPRGDRLLTELAVRAIAELQPKLMMVNYQDPDYVHWGNASHYTRAIAIIDEGLKRLVGAVEASPSYRDRTIFVIVPDCGRDANPLLGLPYQHHFNSRSAHEIWALIFGAGIVRGRVLDKAVDQTAIAPTIAAAMGMRATAAEGRALSEVLL